MKPEAPPGVTGRGLDDGRCDGDRTAWRPRPNQNVAGSGWFRCAVRHRAKQDARETAQPATRQRRAVLHRRPRYSVIDAHPAGTPAMALELRPNCECCDKDLPPDATDARICTFECTFCAECVEAILRNVCPNCGGGFAPRPIRPKTEWRAGLSVEKRPPSTRRVRLSYSLTEIAAFAQRIKDIAPEDR
jgi:uncharacterized protein